jgi:glycosyltransferase involved in cell wall biosynthesis
MRLVIFIYSLNSGGAERVTANLANYWIKKEWDITILTLTPKELDYYHLDPKVKRLSLMLSSESNGICSAIFNNIRRISALRRTLRLIKPSVALSMMSTANILLALSTIGLKDITLVGSEHTHPPRKSLGRFWEALRSKLYGRFTAIAALTEESAKWIRLNTNAQSVVVIANAAPWPLESQNPYLNPVPLSKGKYILLAAGRLSEEKGFDLLISAYAQIAKKFPNWVLIILGEGSARSALFEKIQSFGLEENILLPGRAGNIGEWYEASTLYVMSSRYEGFGNTLAEALTHGLPAVSFDCETGPRTILRHEIDGLLVPAMDTHALRDALKILMIDGTLRKNLAKRAIEARSRFSIERMACQWEDLFSSKHCSR